MTDAEYYKRNIVGTKRKIANLQEKLKYYQIKSDYVYSDKRFNYHKNKTRGEER